MILVILNDSMDSEWFYGFYVIPEIPLIPLILTDSIDSNW
jgi:hypothetical protein